MRGAGGALYRVTAVTRYDSPPIRSPQQPPCSKASGVDVVCVLVPVVAAIVPVLVDDFACEVAVHLTRRELVTGNHGGVGCSGGGGSEIGWGLIESGWEFVIILVVADLKVGCFTRVGLFEFTEVDRILDLFPCVGGHEQ